MATEINLSKDLPSSVHNFSDYKRIIKLVDDIKKVVPEFKMYYKDTSLLMKFLYIVSFIWIWNKRFMESFTTVVGFKVYLPRNRITAHNYSSLEGTLRHEFIHMLQKLRYGIFFTLGYLFPQILYPLCLLSLLSVWFTDWHLMWLFCILFLAPIPAPFRALWEFEGYTESMLFRYEKTNDISNVYISWLAHQFTSLNYWLMWPFKSNLEHEFRSVRFNIYNKSFVSYIDKYMRKLNLDV